MRHNNLISLEDVERRVAEAQEGPQPLMRDIPPADPFPVSELGGLMTPAAIAIHDKTQAPMAICAQSVLAAATLAVQGHADIVLPTGQAKPISEFYMTIAASGERKSACDAEALWGVRKHEANLREQYDEALLSYVNEKDAWDRQRQQVLGDKQLCKDIASKKAALDDLGPEPTPPLSPLITPSDQTIEGIAKLYVFGQPSIGLFAAEGGMFIGGHGMTAEKKLMTATALSCLWDGDPIKRVRAGDGVSILPGRRFAMHLMAQPGVASEMLSDRLLMDQGLLSRVLVTAPDSTTGFRPWKEPRPQSDIDIRTFGARLQNILETPATMTEGKINELAPRQLPLSLKARAMWVQFVDHVERQMAPDGEMEPIRGLANKLPEHAARLAGVLALVDDLNTPEITTAHLASGIALAQHYADEALRLFSNGAIDPDIILAKKTLEWIEQKHRKPIVALRTLYQTGPNPIRTQKKAKPIVAILEGHGWLKPVTESVEVDGHHTMKAWHVISGGAS